MPRPYQNQRTRRFLGILFLSSLTLCLWVGQVSSLPWQMQWTQVATAQSPNPSQLVQQGVERYQTGDFQGAIENWKTALTTYQNTKNQASVAIVLENLARAYQQIGQIDQAINYWEQVIANHRTFGNLKQVGRMRTEQAQAYLLIGQYRTSIDLLCGSSQEKSVCLQESALQIAREQKDRAGETAALGSLGEAYRLKGDYDQAIKYLEQGRDIGNSTYQFSLVNSLGNAHLGRAQLWSIRANSARQLGLQKESEFKAQAQADYKKALQSFESSLQLAEEQNNQPGRMRALLNLIQLSYRSQNLNLIDQADTNRAIQQALVLLKELPNSREKVYATTELANLPASSANISSPLTECSQELKLPDSEVIELLNQAIKIAQNFQDFRSESFAKGALGHFYECRGKSDIALKLTQEALWAADQNLIAKDSLYLWEWQAGRIFKTQGKESQAIAAYEQAFATLEQIRSDILTAERDLQYDFRNVVEPLYREIAQLRLELASIPTTEPERRKKELTNALRTIDSLRLAELQNYFGNDCVLTALNEKSVDEFDFKDTAIFSSIILEDRTAILLSLPKNEKRFGWIEENRKTVTATINQFRSSLFEGRRSLNDYNTTQAEELYDWFIRPFEADLNPKQIKTIVFIQDGILRSIPMAALYDKNQKQFLIEKYAIATTPSLRLTDPKTLNRQENRALILGVTKEAKVDEQTFDALENVPSEIITVSQEFPDNKSLVDENFNRENLTKELDQRVYPVIHIATHAQFGTIAEDTFLVTGNNGKITLNQLEATLRQVSGKSGSVELLTLTACQTAVGDDRAALGLAGVAVQAGVKSALASLWSVPDESTLELVTEFYSSLRSSGVSKAEALRAAQLKLIKAKEIKEINDQYDNPAYWAPFILIGNWL